MFPPHALKLPEGIDAIRQGVPDDRRMILDLIQQAFSASTPDRFWHLYAPERLQAENWSVAISGSRIVGTVGFPRFVYETEGICLPWAGGTGVATAPDWRGKGIMSTLLDVGIKQVDRHGLPVSILRGNRQRYSRFGWEAAGRQLMLTLSRSQFADPAWKPDRLEHIVAQGGLESLPAGLGERLLRIQQQHSGCYLRSLSLQKAISSRLGVHLLMVKEGDAQAYALVGRADSLPLGNSAIKSSQGWNKIYELAGQRDLALALVGHIVRDNAVSMLIKPELDDLGRQLCNRADDYHIVTVGMIRIHNLASLLEAYKPWWAKQGRPDKSGVTLVMTGEPDQPDQCVRIEWTSEKVDIITGLPKKALPAPVVTAERRALTQAIFGPIDPGVALGYQAGSALLRSVFPLPIGIPRLEQV